MITDAAPLHDDQEDEADVCFILEGTYPYVMGGVSGWTHALINSMPDRKIALLTIQENEEQSEPVYDVPDNVIEISNVYLNASHAGRAARRRDVEDILRFHDLAAAIFRRGDDDSFTAARDMVLQSGLSKHALLNSRQAWRAIMRQYEALMPTTSLLQFFWTWRTLVSGLLSTMLCKAPKAKVYHAISTGYAGLVGAQVARRTERPFIITEHGIYTNERRIELYVADWIYDSGRSGLSIAPTMPELRDLWLSAFSSFARIAYDQASEITTLYEGNQVFQMADGAPEEKLTIIPNGVDVERLGAISREACEDHRPTVALIGRVVAIKDIRMFISACAVMKKAIPNVRALILGPDAEEPDYAAECRALVAQLELEDTIEFCGRVNISDYLPEIDLLVLTSLSEAQPLVLLEAGAASIPSVTTDVGSCRQIIEGFAGDTVQGLGGRVVSCGDAGAAGRALVELLDNEELRRDMGAVMRERVSVTYNKKAIDQRYHDLYDHWTAMGQRRPEPTARFAHEPVEA